LPTHKFRRLHLNLPGALNGAFLDQGVVLDAIATGRIALPPQSGVRYVGFVDMSGGMIAGFVCLGFMASRGRKNRSASLAPA
jgi:hypothetical protein